MLFFLSCSFSEMSGSVKKDKRILPSCLSLVEMCEWRQYTFCTNERKKKREEENICRLTRLELSSFLLYWTARNLSESDDRTNFKPVNAGWQWSEKDDDDDEEKYPHQWKGYVYNDRGRMVVFVWSTNKRKRKVHHSYQHDDQLGVYK